MAVFPRKIQGTPPGKKTIFNFQAQDDLPQKILVSPPRFKKKPIKNPPTTKIGPSPHIN